MNETNANSFGSEQGSPNNDPTKNGAVGQSGVQSPKTNDNSDTIPVEQYKELEKKIGEMGVELGDYREFYKDILPIVTKLEDKPELIKAILDDKISADLIKSVTEGTVTPQVAQTVTKAHEEVKKELGKGYQSSSVEDIEKMVQAKVAEAFGKTREEFDAKLTEAERLREYEERVQTFIGNTPDFPQYAIAIDRWFEEHPDQYDIKMAYDTVKGADTIAKLKEKESENSADYAKGVAANAGGGQSRSSANLTEKDVLDQLIGKPHNPNIF